VVGIFVKVAASGARTCGMFFSLCHSAASCAEPGGEFNSPSMHADHLAFYHLPNGAPVYQVSVDVPESCFPSPVCLHCFASHLLKEVVFQVCTDFLVLGKFSTLRHGTVWVFHVVVCYIGPSVP